MQQEIVDTIKNNPKFQELVAKRNKLAWTLSIIMLAIYYSFILVIAFTPASLATPISEGSVITVGIPVGLVIIVSAFILTGVYVKRANSEFDAITNQIKEEVK